MDYVTVQHAFHSASDSDSDEEGNVAQRKATLKEKKLGNKKKKKTMKSWLDISDSENESDIHFLNSSLDESPPKQKDVPSPSKKQKRSFLSSDEESSNTDDTIVNIIHSPQPKRLKRAAKEKATQVIKEKITQPNTKPSEKTLSKEKENGKKRKRLTAEEIESFICDSESEEEVNNPQKRQKTAADKLESSVKEVGEKEKEKEKEEEEEEEEEEESDIEVDENGVLYFKPVRTTIDSETGVKLTKFPRNFYGPTGLGTFEYSSLLKHCRNANRNLGRKSDLFDGYGGHHSPNYAHYASQALVRSPSQDTKDGLLNAFTTTSMTPKPYLTPSSLPWLHAKYARYLFRKPITMPKKFPYLFCPHSHSYIYNEKGLQNVITGTSIEGHSVTLRVTGFLPYCYVGLAQDLFAASKRSEAEIKRILTGYLSALNTSISEYTKTKQRYLHYKISDGQFVTLDPIIEYHLSTKGYQGRVPKPFLKIYAVHPQLIRPIRKLIQRPFGLLPGDIDEGDSQVGGWLGERYKEYGFEDVGVAYDAHVDYTVRFLADLALKSSSFWFVFNTYKVEQVAVADRISTSNLELLANYKNLRSASDKFVENNPAIRLECKFDIEVETEKNFPKPKTNAITQIVMRFQFAPLESLKAEDDTHMFNTPMPPNETVRKSGCSVNICLCLRKTNPLPNCDVHYFDDERLLIMVCHELMVAIQPDFMAGHYSDNFDFVFKLYRAEHLGLAAFPFFARYFAKPVTNNSGKAKTTVKGIDRPVTHIPGMVVWDFFKFVSDYTFEKTKSLDALAAKHLKHQKIAVEYSAIGLLMKIVAGRDLLVDYCNRDVVLLQELDTSMSALKQLHEMGCLCYIPIQLLGDRASTFRMLGLWHYYAQRYYNRAYSHTPGPDQLAITTPAEQEVDAELGDLPTPQDFYDKSNPNFDEDKHLSEILFLTPSPDLHCVPTEGDSYGGGGVLEPQRDYGKRPDEPELTLDYRSLYPSLMIAFNIGHMTQIAAGYQDLVCAALGLDRKRDLWDEPTMLLTADERTTRPYRDPDHNPSYVRKHVMVSLVSYLEDYVMVVRGKAKKSMKEYRNLAKKERDPKLKVVYETLAGNKNVLQMIVKVVGNGMYGNFGMPNGAFSNLACASTITNLARQSLEFTRYTCFRSIRKVNGFDFDCTINYGDTDSVFPLLMDPEPGTPLTTNTLPTKPKVKEYIFDQGQLMADLVNKKLPTDMLLQMEKAAETWYHCTPKCYALMKCESRAADDPYYLSASGLSYARRGGCPLQRNMCRAYIDALLVKRDPYEAVRVVRKTVKRVLRRELTFSEILMRSSLSKDIDKYGDIEPPHVAMAKKIRERSGLELKGGDRVYFIVTPGPPKAKVTERVETPDFALENSIGYDILYYLEVVLKEAKKLMRALVDPATFCERFEFSEWVRIMKGKPGGKDKIKKAKNELKKKCDKIVMSVIMGERELNLDRPPRKLSDLPEKYQTPDPPLAWNWAGFDPDEDVPHISEYKVPWIKSETEKATLINEIREALCEKEMNIDGEDENEENAIPDLKIDPELESLLNLKKSNGIPGLSSDEKDEINKEVEKENDTEITHTFCKAFVSERKESYRTLSELEEKLGIPQQERLGGYTKYIKRAKMPENSALGAFVKPKLECKGCHRYVDEKYMGLCKRCEVKGLRADTRIQFETDIADSIVEWERKKKETYKICFDCSLNTCRNAKADVRRTFISQCTRVSDCPASNWVPVRESPRELNKAIKKLEWCRTLKERLNTESESEEDVRDIEDGYSFCKTKEEIGERNKKKVKNVKKRKEKKTNGKKKPDKAAGMKSLESFFTVQK